MRDTNHTPAPWHTNGKYILATIARNGVGGIVLAQMIPVEREDRDANARLIAAAPTGKALVEALFREYKKHVPDSHLDTFLVESVETYFASINGQTLKEYLADDIQEAINGR